MKPINEVEVVIGGEVFVLASNDNVEYIHKLARYIDKKIQEIESIKSIAAMNSHTRTLLISLNIADDLLKEKEAALSTKGQHSKELGAYRTELDKLQKENFLLNEKIRDLQLKLEETQRELADYIELFEQGG